MPSAGQVFTLCNIAVLPAWLLLAVLPGWRWTRVIAAYLTPSLLAILYIVLMLVRFDSNVGGFGSIDEVSQMFQNPWLLLAWWVHYLVFDLFVGAWQVRDAQRLGIRHGLVIPCLALTFVAGPAGLLVYFALRAFLIRRWPGVEPG